MRETDMASIGISDGRPQPMSTKHPKGSRCVTFAGITSPDEHNIIVELPFGKGIIPRSEGAIGIQEGKTKDKLIFNVLKY